MPSYNLRALNAWIHSTSFGRLSPSPLAAGETDIFLLLLDGDDASELCYYQVLRTCAFSVPYPRSSARKVIRAYPETLP